MDRRASELGPRSLRLEHALTAAGWVAPARLEIDSSGQIREICQAAASDSFDSEVAGYALPSLPNLHSHAFQRAMAGHAETRSPDRTHDSFWTWREAMYRLAATIDVDQLEAIATWLFVEMLESGSTAVAEFHYLHHEARGRRPEPTTAYAQAILRAAGRTGIAVTLLPVLYLHGGFGQSPAPHQERFTHDTVEEFVALYRELEAHVAASTDARLGVAFHSLRAVLPSEMQEALAALGSDPVAVHVHVSEQQQEVDDCVAATGKRPLRLLLDEGLVDARTCLVHATHLDAGELRDAARSGAIAGLCPTTEGNLGDGIFLLQEWLAEGGAWGIGSDSHISVDPLEELRLLEYGQRLTKQRRAIASRADRNSVGRSLWEGASEGGARALGQPVGTLDVGKRADFVVLDADHPRLIGHGADSVCDAAVFSHAGPTPVREVWVAGRRIVSDGAHVDREAALSDFRRAVRRS